MSSQLSQSQDAHFNRYASLVQPIKDLAANWDIDIAENLGEYLEELDHLRITMDGGQTQLNFAEAALLIQGSTAIYSKKVEYLHQLVLKSLEFITQKKSGKNKEGNSNTKNTDANDRTYDEDFLLNFGDLSEPKDLLLDHLIEEGENIDLPANANSNIVHNGRFYVNDKDAMNTSMDSMGGKSQGNVSRVSVSLLHSLLQDGSTSGSGASLRLLSSAYLDQSGALLLGAFRPSYFKPLSSSNVNTNATHSETTNLFPPVDSSASIGYANAADTEHVTYSGEDYHNDNDDHYYDYDDVPYDAPADTAAAPPMNTALSAPPVAVHHQHIVTSLPKAGTPAQFQLLDPHTVLPGSRPVAKGRPYRIPSKTQLKKEQEESMRQAVKRCLLLPIYTADPAMQLLFPSDASQGQKKRKEKPLPVKGLLEPQLLPLLQLKRKLQRIRRMKLMRESRQQQAMQHSVLDDCVWEHPGAAGVSQDTFQANADTVDDHNINDNFNDHYDTYDDNDHFYPDYQTEEVPEEVDEAEELAQRSQQIDAALYNNRALSSGQVYGIDDELAPSLEAAGHTYEMLCRQYLEGFQRGADAFARETQLSMRVAAWTQKLEPVLLKQEEEKPFDIHEYSDSVLQNLSHLTLNKAEEDVSKEKDEEVEVGFAEVVAGKNSGEVCRVFLACLQLANLGNVDVIRPSDVNQNVDKTSFNKMEPFQLKLLKEERDNKEMNSFQNYETLVDENYGNHETGMAKKSKGANNNGKKGRGKAKKTTFVI